MEQEHKNEASSPKPHTRRLSGFLFRFRNIALVIAIGFILISAAFLLFVGLFNGVKAMSTFFTDYSVSAVLSGLIKTMDIFLASLVMMLLAVGIYDLFVVSSFRDDQEKVCRGWDGFATLDELKSSLAKLIVIILTVTYLELVLANLDRMSGVQILYVPAGGFLIAASLWLTLRK